MTDIPRGQSLQLEAETVSIETLRGRAAAIRRNVVRMARGKGEGYVGQGLQAADVLAVLFFAELDWRLEASPRTDRFLLSAGHYSIGLWAVFAELGVIDSDTLDSYGADGTEVAMSTERGKQPGVELTGGSLGHGLGVAAGIALGRRQQDESGRVVNYMTDGESQEGSTWEAAMFAAHAGLSRLVNVVDVNRTQADGPLVVEVEPLAEKFRAFGWWAEDVDGNDLRSLLQAFARARLEADRPKALICHTTLGFGAPLIMERARAHFVRVDSHEWDTVAGQVEATA